MLKGSKTQKLYDISKNQPPMSIRRRDMKISLLFNFKKVLFLPYLLLPKLSWKVEIRYVHLVGTLDEPFGDLDFSAPFHPFTASKKWFVGRIFLFPSFLEFFACINSPPN